MNNNHRPYVRKSTTETLEYQASILQVSDEDKLKDLQDRQIRDPHTNEVIEDGQKVKGHVAELENKGLVDYSNKAGMSQKELNDIANTAGIYSFEDRHSNASHVYESHDENQTALSTANFCYLEKSKYQENTFINPPGNENGEKWTLTTENADDNQTYEIGTFVPDINNTESSNDSMNNNEANQAENNSVNDSEEINQVDDDEESMSL